MAFDWPGVIDHSKHNASSDVLLLERVLSTRVAPLEFRCTPAARALLAAVCQRDGRQAVILAWPAGATYLPADMYLPAENDVILGHVADCPVFVDARRTALFRDRHVVLDASAASSRRRRPPLVVRDRPAPL